MPRAMVQSVLLLSSLFCSGMKGLSSFPKEGTAILLTAEVAAYQRRCEGDKRGHLDEEKAYTVLYFLLHLPESEIA